MNLILTLALWAVVVALIAGSVWGETMLRDEDRIEIVHFVGGGFVPFYESDTI